MSYQIEITPLGIELLAKIKDRREQTVLKQRINKLKLEPDKQGKALSGKLKGYRSVRALGQRYRIVYKVDRAKVTVIVVGAGIRKDGSKKDIYAILNKFFTQ